MLLIPNSLPGEASGMALNTPEIIPKLVVSFQNGAGDSPKTAVVLQTCSYCRFGASSAQPAQDSTSQTPVMAAGTGKAIMSQTAFPCSSFLGD